MRKVLKWLGIGVAAVAALVGYLVYEGAKLDGEASAYADGAVLAVTSRWDRQQLLDRAAPGLLAHTSPEQFATLFDVFATLGPLSGDRPGCKGGVAVNAAIGRATVQTGRYACEARYQNGAATIRLDLVKSGDAWRIEGFRVDSPTLLARFPERKS